MARSHPLYHLTMAKIRALVREPEILFWVFGFPVLLTLALGIAFRDQGEAAVPTGVQDGPGADAIIEVLKSDPGVDVRRLDAADADRALRRGDVAIVVIPGDPVSYWFDPTRQESRMARLAVDDALERGAGRQDLFDTENREMTDLGSRYIDFLLPGLLGMNLMGTGMWGIGFYIVTARSRGVLKRFMATPMRRVDYLLSQILGRMVFLVIEVAVILGFGHLAFDVPVRGSWIEIALICLIGAMSFAGLGLLVASRARTVEGVSGLMNLVMMPMWILSGIFFSTERFPDVMQPWIQVLPLTALIDALRQVLLDGARVWEVGGDVLVVAAWGALSFAIALRWFRWR